MTIEVRRLTVGDEEVRRRLSIDDARFDAAGAEGTARTPHTVSGAREFLAAEGNVQLVAFAGEEPVGQLLAYELNRRHGDGRMMYVHEVGVRDDWRRAGIARMLFEALAEICRRRGRFLLLRHHQRRQRAGDGLVPGARRHTGCHRRGGLQLRLPLNAPVGAIDPVSGR
jgi:GNAT superfamily N-acetyltransferase